MKGEEEGERRREGDAEVKGEGERKSQKGRERKRGWSGAQEIIRTSRYLDLRGQWLFVCGGVRWFGCR